MQPHDRLPDSSCHFFSSACAITQYIFTSKIFSFATVHSSNKNDATNEEKKEEKNEKKHKAFAVSGLQICTIFVILTFNNSGRL